MMRVMRSMKKACVALLTLAVTLCLAIGCSSNKGNDAIPAAKPIMTTQEKEKVADMYQDYMTKMAPKSATENVAKFRGEQPTKDANQQSAPANSKQ
jgi:uncharacterized protein YcfL